MKLKFGRTAMWVWMTVCFAAAAFAAVQDLPEGEGKAVLESNCQGCHDLDRVKSEHYDKDSWQGIVESMREMQNDSALTDEDIQVLATYLAKNFGPEDAKPADEPDAELKQLVENTCSSCHGMDLVEAQHIDQAGWEGVIKGMIAIGASLTNEQIPVIADYLAKTYK